MEKSVQLGSVRFNLQSMLLELGNYDFQLEWYCDPERRKIPDYVGVWLTLQTFIDEFDWEDEESESLIGTILRNEAELTACLAVYMPVLELYRRKNRSGIDEDYINDRAWPQIIAAARHALRIMLQGDS